ncbi:MAG: lipopolysaccharide heptosyltransferase II [Candidatus Omnitrophota bacterium]|nr:lipopolysaccharide heptosyltransferase II [Candidatus Omnitrophota bacterium]
MNILQLVPKLNVGGVERGTVDVVRYLTLNGHKAVVVSGGGPLERNIAAIGARHYTLPVGRKNPFVMVYSFFRLRHLILKENIDIVHARSRVPALIGYFAARSTHRKFMTTAHGQYKKHLISRVMGWGKVVIAANETMARHMKENFGVPLRKISIIPRGVDLKKFSFVPPSGKKGKTFRVGMISRFTPLKGHLDFLKAVSFVSRRTHNLEVILMGDRSSAREGYMEKIRLTIRRLMLGDIVKFRDSDEDVAKVMKEIDVLVSANREQEAFGRTIVEAQASGVPVVATRVGGVLENVEDGETGLLCEPGDPSDMSEKILRYAKDPGLAKKAAANARRFVEEKYSLDRTMRMTMEAYSRVLSAKNILVFKISSLGDVILSVPSLRAIRKRFPEAGIKALVDVRFREVLDNCPYIDEAIVCDLKGRDRGWALLKLAEKLRSDDFDISIDLQNSRKSHLLAFLSSIPERYGFDNGKSSFFLNRKTSLPDKPMGPIEHQACVLGLLGITKIEKRLELWPGKDDEAWAHSFLDSKWLKKDQKLVAISLLASKRWTTKNWGITSMAELADMLAREEGIRVVIVGADDNRSGADKFMKKTGAKPIDAVGKTSIPRFASLIRRCNAIIVGDSAPMHVAAAMGTPFVALFGPTDPERHLPPAENYRILYKKLKCSPCYKSACFRGIKCMKSINPGDVYDALMQVMEVKNEKFKIKL